MVDGRRIDGNGRTRKAARADAESKARSAGATTGPMTVQGLYDDWAAHAPEDHGLRGTTFDQYCSLIRTKITPEIGKNKVSAITQKTLTDLVRSWEGSASTRRSAHAALVKLFDHAVSLDLLARNIARDIPRPSASPPRHRSIALDDLARMLAAAKGHRWEAAVWLAFGLGLRRGEILGLRWDDVDLEAATATISLEGNLVRSSQGLVSGPPKTRSGLRQVHLPQAVVAALRNRLTKQAEEQLKSSVWCGSGHVISTHMGGPVEPRAFSRVWRSWANKAGLEDTGVHVSRHYAATVMLGSGQASVADIAAALGHDPAVLLSTYAVPVAEGQRRAADVLGGTLVKASEVSFEVKSPKRARKRSDTQGSVSRQKPSISKESKAKRAMP